MALLALLALMGLYFGRKVYAVFVFRGLHPPRILFWGLLAAGLLAVLYTRSALLCLPLYALMFFAAGDLAGLALGPLASAGVKSLAVRLWQGGLTPLLAGLLVAALAAHIAHNPVLTRYTLALDKDFGPAEGITVVMLSDVHLGTAVGEAELPALVERVNAQSPDVIALCGDIFEEGTTPALRTAAIAAFSGFEAADGVFYVTGNHDGGTEAELADLTAAGITVLGDRWVLVDDRYYVAGRQDAGHRGEYPRAEAEAVLAGADRQKPIILLDHQPSAWPEARAAGADLQLSGHTHAGQLWPFGLLSRLTNGINYGVKSAEGFHIVVSSGYGVWGFEARTSQRCEYVRVDLTPQGG